MTDRRIGPAQAKKERSLLDNDYATPCPECGGVVFDWWDTETCRDCEDSEDETGSQQTTLTDGGVDRPEHPVSHVVVLRGASKNRYHRDDGNGDPACPVLERSDRDTPARSLWDIEKADAWREPCQYDACFGNRDGWSDERKVVLPSSTEVPADD